MKAMGFKQSDWMGLLFVLAASLMICSIVYSNFVLQRGQMMWDEAEHALTGLAFASDIQKSDFYSLAAHFHQQILWPPLHPLFLSVIFLLFGKSVIAARASSVALYFLFSMAMHFLGREVAQKNKHVSGTLCSVFALVTGSFYLSASEAMLEMLALLFFTLSILFFLKFLKDRRNWWLVSAFIMLTFFSKTNFGIALMLSIAIYLLIHERFRFASIIRNRDYLMMLAPVALAILLWLMPPDRLLIFLGFLVNRPEGPPPFSIEGLLLYPTELFIYSGVLIALYIAALALSFRHLKNDKVRFLVIITLLVILLNFFHQNKKIRYILYLYPPLFSLASFHLANLYARIKHRRKQVAFYVLIAACMAAFSFYLSGNARLYGYSFSVTEPLDFIKNSTENSGSIFVLGEINEISPGLIGWHLSSITNMKEIKASAYAVWEFSPGTFDGLKIQNATPDAEGMNSFLSRHAFDAIALMELQNASVFYNTADYLIYNRWKLDYIPIIMENRNYSVESRKAFPDSGLEIIILRRSGS